MLGSGLMFPPQLEDSLSSLLKYLEPNQLPVHGWVFHDPLDLMLTSLSNDTKTVRTTINLSKCLQSKCYSCKSNHRK